MGIKLLGKDILKRVTGKGLSIVQAKGAVGKNNKGFLKPSTLNSAQLAEHTCISLDDTGQEDIT